MSDTKTTRAGIAYACVSHRDSLDLYLPQAMRPPVVIWVHGGAFMMGDKTAPQSLDTLLAAGFAVVSINYRLTGTDLWPAQLEDVVAAVNYVRGHAGDLGVDGGRIALFGASAGGFLVATAGIALAGTPGAVQAVVDWYGPVQFTTMDADIAATGVARATGRNDGDTSPESRLIGQGVAANPQAANAVSPLAWLARATAALPAFLIMHGDEDNFIGRGQSERLRDALLASRWNRGVDYHLLAGAGHGSGMFQEPAATQIVVDFLGSALK